jgi:hypothetical protein
MKGIRVIFLVALISLLSYLTVTAEEILTNETVLSMMKAGLGEELVISKIKNSRNKFDVSVDGILKLKKEGTSEGIIKTMIESSGTAESTRQGIRRSDQFEDLYNQAIALKEDLDYDSAYAILKKLADQNPDINIYQIQYVDTILEMIRELKRSDDSSWNSKAQEAQSRIFNYAGNPQYYLIYAKYLLVVDLPTNRDPYTYLSKASKIASDVNDHWNKIINGDVYFYLARNKKKKELLPGQIYYESKQIGLKGKSSYEAALSTPNLNDRTKAYIYYKLGELEYWYLGTSESANAYWAKTVALSPGGKIAETAKKWMEK